MPLAPTTTAAALPVTARQSQLTKRLGLLRRLWFTVFIGVVVFAAAGVAPALILGGAAAFIYSGVIAGGFIAGIIVLVCFIRTETEEFDLQHAARTRVDT